MAKEGKKPLGKIILIVVIVLVAIGVFGSLGGNNSGSSFSDSTKEEQTQTQAEPESKAQDPYTISDETADTSNQFAYKITGTLTNNTDQKKSYIQVEYTLYDADGNQVGTALANTNNLKAGGTWKFEATGTVSPDKVANCERSDVSGF